MVKMRSSISEDEALGGHLEISREPHFNFKIIAAGTINLWHVTHVQELMNGRQC